jgi:uncharacterized protein (DUF4415 family)
MALKPRVEDQVLGGGYQITADDTVYKLQIGGALRHYEPRPGDKAFDGSPAQPADAPYIYVTATPVNPKTHKPITGADSQTQYYRAGWDLTHFVPANVVDGDLDKLAAKVQVSDKNLVGYRTLATQKGEDTGFLKGGEAALLMNAIQMGVDFDVQYLDELSGIVCTFTEVDTGKKDKLGKPKMLSVPSKILAGPGGESVNGQPAASKAVAAEQEEPAEEEVAQPKAKAKAKVAPVEEEEPAPAPKAKAGKAVKPALTAEAIALRIVEETIESLQAKGTDFDAAKLAKSSKRNATMDDQLEANPDLNDDVMDLLANVKWITKQMPE